MAKEFLVEELRKISNSLDKITEAEQGATPVKAPAAAPAPVPGPQQTPAVNTAAADASADQSVNDIMTKEKQPGKLQGSVAVRDLAKLLGIQNYNLFTIAFSSLRQGKLPNNAAQVRMLAIAFDKLLAADAATTGKVLNQLRRIHKAS